MKADTHSTRTDSNLPDDFEETDVEHTGLQATFDYLSIHAVVVNPNVRHVLYGLPYSEYKKRRSRSIDKDADSRNSKISFCCDPVVGALVATLARRRDMSKYAYINDMLEEGQIHFHPEYHDTYESINNILDDLTNRMSNDAQAKAVIRLKDQKISIGVCARGNPKFTPRVGYWLAEDIASTAIDLHMSISDAAYLYLITGILSADAIEIPITPYQDKIMSTVLQNFVRDLSAMEDICQHIHATFDKIL